MPSSMDRNAREKLKHALLEKRQRTFQLLSQTGEDSEPLSQSEMMDMAQALEQQGRDRSLAEQELREIEAIERALAKLGAPTPLGSEGHFGFCEDCEEEIPLRRLMIVPEARLCAQCQAIEERRNSRQIQRL